LHFQELIDDRIKLAGPSLNLSALGPSNRYGASLLSG